MKPEFHNHSTSTGSYLRYTPLTVTTFHLFCVLRVFLFILPLSFFRFLRLFCDIYDNLDILFLPCSALVKFTRSFFVVFVTLKMKTRSSLKRLENKDVRPSLGRYLYRKIAQVHAVEARATNTEDLPVCQEEPFQI